MFNPCYPFTKELLDSMIEKEVKYFVRSTFKRGLKPGVKGAFIISHYHDKAEAERHYNAIKHDPYRLFYDASVPELRERLYKAATMGDEYAVFSKIIIPGMEKEATRTFKEETKRYLYNNTDWDLKGRVTIYPHLYFQLGELYARIAHEGDEIKIKFEDIENC